MSSLNDYICALHNRSQFCFKLELNKTTFFRYNWLRKGILYGLISCLASAWKLEVWFAWRLQRHKVLRVCRYSDGAVAHFAASLYSPLEEVLASLLGDEVCFLWTVVCLAVYSINLLFLLWNVSELSRVWLQKFDNLNLLLNHKNSLLVLLPKGWRRMSFYQCHCLRRKHLISKDQYLRN